MAHQQPKGVFDIAPLRALPSDSEAWRASELWQEVEATIRRICRYYGYHEIRTPMFEMTELFRRGVGETSDIVSKEMYTFEDKGKRSLTLRPEGTAPVMRAFIDGHMSQQLPEHKLFYVGPMFRYERPQSGRYRQHHQFGAEAIGLRCPEQDAEIIDLLYTTYQELGLQNLQVCINCLGSKDARQKYRQALVDFLSPRQTDLSEDSKRRLESNPLRILDSKDQKDRALIEEAPRLIDFVDADDRQQFDRLLHLLNKLKVPYTIDSLLVRGLDYYNNTVFEVQSGELGAQNSVGGGGRYDGLLKQLGGPDLPAMGFGTGIERIIHTMIQQNAGKVSASGPLLYIIPLGESAQEECFSLMHQMRKQGIPVQMDFSQRKLKKTMSYADKIAAEFIVVIGDQELAQNRVTLKEMRSGVELSVELSNLVVEFLSFVASRRKQNLESVVDELNSLLGMESLKQRSIKTIQDPS